MGQGEGGRGGGSPENEQPQERILLPLGVSGRPVENPREPRLRPSLGKGEQTLRQARRPDGQKCSLLPSRHVMPGPQGHPDWTELWLLWGWGRLLLTKQSDCCQMWAAGQLLHNSGLSFLHTVQLKGALEVGL